MSTNVTVSPLLKKINLSISEIMARTGPALGSTLRNKNVQERGGMRNQRAEATKLANSRKKKTSS